MFLYLTGRQIDRRLAPHGNNINNERARRVLSSLIKEFSRPAPKLNKVFWSARPSVCLPTVGCFAGQLRGARDPRANFLLLLLLLSTF